MTAPSPGELVTMECEVVRVIGTTPRGVFLQVRLASDEWLRLHDAPRKATGEWSAPDEGIAVPRWVPDRLAGLYRDIAHREGEERAASVVRKLKAGEPVR